MAPPRENPHQKIINSMMQMVGYLTDHPEFPVGPNATAMLVVVHPDWPHVSDSDQVAFVREVARIFDVEPQWEGTTRLSATLAWDRAGIEAVATFGAATREAVESAAVYPVTAADSEQLPAAVEADQALPEVDCPNCRGTGFEHAAPGGTCPYCLGKGRLAAPWQPAAETGARW